MTDDDKEPPFTQWLATSRLTWWLQLAILGAAPWVLEFWIGQASGWR